MDLDPNDQINRLLIIMRQGDSIEPDNPIIPINIINESIIKIDKIQNILTRVIKDKLKEPLDKTYWEGTNNTINWNIPIEVLVYLILINLDKMIWKSIYSTCRLLRDIFKMLSIIFIDKHTIAFNDINGHQYYYGKVKICNNYKCYFHFPNTKKVFYMNIHYSCMHQCPHCHKIGNIHKVRHPEVLSNYLTEKYIKDNAGNRILFNPKSHQESTPCLCLYKCPCGKNHSKNEHLCYYCRKIGYMHEENQCPEICLCGKKRSFMLADYNCSICLHPERFCDEKCSCYKKRFHRKSEHKCIICYGYHLEKNCPVYHRNLCCICHKNHLEKDCPGHHRYLCRICHKNHSEQTCPKKCLCGKNNHTIDKHRCYSCRLIGIYHNPHSCFNIINVSTSLSSLSSISLLSSSSSSSSSSSLSSSSSSSSSSSTYLYRHPHYYASRQ